MGEKKNDEIKFEDLTDNYTYQENSNQSGFNPPPSGNPFWHQPGYNQQSSQNNNGYNIASLVLGIFSIVCCCLYGILSLILGGLAITFFVISKKNGTSNGLAVAGLICAIFGISLGLFFGIFTLVNLPEIMAAANEAATSLL